MYSIGQELVCTVTTVRGKAAPSIKDTRDCSAIREVTPGRILSLTEQDSLMRKRKVPVQRD